MPHSASPWLPDGAQAEVLQVENASDWDALAGIYGGGRPFRQVLNVARENGCQTVVVEYRYIDVDYRSEHAAFWALRFDVPSPFTRRLHFFATEVRGDQIHILSEDAGYLGYSVLRPFPVGRVGRTVLKPPPALRDATLTTITERVSFFGNDLEVEGVPFTEQDAEYLRCAHAAAWNCHYIASRRGLVGRRSTSNLVSLTPDVVSAERALPSPGLSLIQLQAVFGATGQPALLYGFSSLPDVVGVNPPTPVLDPDGEALDPGYWDTRCFSIICRYLNSGFPVLVAGDGHAWTLVGWKRGPDHKVQFIACDDQIGPYEIVTDPFSHYRAPWHSIMVPLPPKVFLTGESAETNASKVLLGVATAVPGLASLGSGLNDGSVHLRTRLMSVQQFKREVAHLSTADDALRAVRVAQMPHFVWIVEAHDSAVCHTGDPCVMASVVFDATSSDRSPQPLALSVAGAVAVYGPGGSPTPAVAPSSTDRWESMLPVH